jgi:hypothetical protein
MGNEGLDWINLAWDRDYWRDFANSSEPSGSIKGGEFLDQLSYCQQKDSTIYSQSFSP